MNKISPRNKLDSNTMLLGTNLRYQHMYRQPTNDTTFKYTTDEPHTTIFPHFHFVFLNLFCLHFPLPPFYRGRLVNEWYQAPAGLAELDVIFFEVLGQGFLLIANARNQHDEIGGRDECHKAGGARKVLTGQRVA